MAAVVGGFIPLLVSGAEITPGAGLNPFPVWITPLTATLIHGGYAHLLLNMVMFVYCGRMVERGLGTRGLIILYVVGAYVSAGGQWLQAPPSPVPKLGRSSCRARGWSNLQISGVPVYLQKNHKTTTQCD